ncbi:interferon lambda-3-like [Ambystoma mexicanum]|uniref:interferon lambda-3-like n=1 Tax=Ambystoma mexicanum TaxID=8296 RepID=UPI0037E7AF1D
MAETVTLQKRGAEREESAQEKGRTAHRHGCEGIDPGHGSPDRSHHRGVPQEAQCKVLHLPVQDPPPSQLRAVQELRDKYEETMLSQIQRCSGKLLQQRPSVLHFTVQDRIIFIEEKAGLAVQVLKNFSNPELSKYMSKPLETLVTIREDLRHCRSSRTHVSRPSPRLDIWLQKFHKEKEMESQECLQETVIFNLFRMLKEDVKCAAYMEECDKMQQRQALPTGITAANQKQE